jgi:hypothetical protein
MSIRDVRKSRGRPATGKGEPVTIRFQPEQLAAIDAWIARHPDPKPTRPEAVRQIVAGALGSHGPSSTLPGFVTGRDIV